MFFSKILRKELSKEPDYDKIGHDYYKALVKQDNEKCEQIAVKICNDLIDEMNEKNMGIGLDLKDAAERRKLEESQDPNHTGGRKFDGGKLQYGLLPPLALKETVRVLTFGAEKYEPDNWRRVPDGARRYFDAAQRHLWAYREGERYDPETEVNHLAHAICCLMFMLDLDEQGVNDTVIKQQIKKKISKGRMESGI